jgi:hypothetical protein
MDEISDPQRREARLAPAAARGSAGTKALGVEDGRDLGIDVMIEQLIDARDELGRGFHLLGGGLGVKGRERLGLPALEADVDLGEVFGWELEQCGILNEVGEQALAVAVGRAWILPKRLEVRCQGG